MGFLKAALAGVIAFLAVLTSPLWSWAVTKSDDQQQREALDWFKRQKPDGRPVRIVFGEREVLDLNLVGGGCIRWTQGFYQVIEIMIDGGAANAVRIASGSAEFREAVRIWKQHCAA